MIDNLIILGCIGCFGYYLYYQFISRRRGYPNGPIPLPVIGNLHQIDFDAPHVTMANWKKIYGPVFTVWLPKANVVIADYSTLKEALIKQGDTFAGRYIGFVYGIFTRHVIDGTGIILSQKAGWQAQRRFSLHVFRNFGMGSNLMERKVMHQTWILIDHIKHEMNNNKSQVMNLELAISLCVGNIIHDLIMGRGFEYGDPKFTHFKHLIDSTLKQVASPQLLFIDTYPWLRFIIPGALGLTQYSKNGFAIQDFFLNEIEDHKKVLKLDSAPEDYIDCYLLEMERRRKAGEDMKHYDERTLAINVGDLWTGGMETTLTTLRWGILYLIRYPEVQAKVYREIRSELGTTPVCMADKARMPYMSATLNEIQRIINILPWNIQHSTLNDTVLSGHKIRQGTTIMAQIAAVHVDPDVFPEPFEFRPQRFLDKSGQLIKIEEFNPFGLGKRSCLGESLARMELFLIFTTLMQHFRFACVPGQVPTLKPIVGMTTVPRPYDCVVSLRNDNGH
uniref:Uncharacterized protein n=1 Tax=Plectus sambesii TaxID=2011161 RepID=A0A914VHD7_9BILA